MSLPREIPVARPEATIVEGALTSPEPTTSELNLRRSKLAQEIAEALRRQAPPPSRFADE